MQTNAFAVSLPLSRHAPRYKAARISHRPLRTTCVAKPPPRMPDSKANSRSTKRKKRKRTNKVQNEGSRVLESLTAAQISEKLLQAVGIDLIQEDVARLTKFFRSFLKPKASDRLNQELQGQMKAHAKSETRLAVSDDSPSYEPKSVTAKRIVASYVKARGAVDRAFQIVSIRAQSYVTTAVQVAGDAVYTLLSAGHQAFPALRLDKAKDTVANALKDGWTPLSVFQWQLLASPTDSIEERRKNRIRQILSFMRGAGLNGFLYTTGSALTGVGRTVEKLAPIAFKGVIKVASGYYDGNPTQKAPKRTLSGAGAAALQKERKYKRQYNESRLQKDVSNQEYLTSSSDQTGIPLRASAKIKGVRPRRINHPRVGSMSIKTPRPISQTRTTHEESRLRAKANLSISKTAAEDENSTRENLSKQDAGLIRNSAIVLAAGALAAATMTVSIPTAITCSTLIVTSMALSSAKAAYATEYQAYTPLSLRQSRSVQNLENAVAKLSTGSDLQTKVPQTPDFSAEHEKRERNGQESRVTSSFEMDALIADNLKSETIETSSYAVSMSQPHILSAPVIGFLLSCSDLVALQVERFIGTLLRRSLLRYSGIRSTTEWELLRSFQKGSEPD